MASPPRDDRPEPALDRVGRGAPGPAGELATARRARLGGAPRRALVFAGLPLALGLVFLGLASASGQEASAPALAPTARAAARTTTVVLVRHAEKDPAGDARDPGLSPAGRERAERLAKLLAKSGASRLYASEFKRTRESLAPLGLLLGLEVTSVPAAEAPRLKAELDALADGAVAVVAGHSNTVPALARALGAELPGLAPSPHGPVLDERDHGRIFVLTRRVEPGSAVEARLLELACPE